jgi:hypothetical protein
MSEDQPCCEGDTKRKLDQAQKPGEEQPCENCPHCAGPAALANGIDRAIDAIGFGMIWLVDPFPYTYTVGCPNDMVYILAGNFEPLEFNGLMQEIVPQLIARHSELAPHIADGSVITIEGLRMPVELQPVHNEFVEAGLFHQAQIRTANKIRCYQIIVGYDGYLPDNPEYEGVDQIDLMTFEIQPDLSIDKIDAIA